MHISSYEICLERVAEEFMGRRKWKNYQEQATRSQLNIEEQQPIATAGSDEDEDNKDNRNHCKPENQHHRLEQQFEEDFVVGNSTDNQTSQDSSRTATPISIPSPPPEPNDWRPSDKCNFCVNGRLLTVNAQGQLVAETVAPTATVHSSSSSTSKGPIYHNGQHDSDSNSSASLHQSGARNIANSGNSLELYKLLTQRAAKMTSMDSMAAQLAQFSLLADFNLINSLASQQQQQQQQQQQHPPHNSVTTTTSELLSAAAISAALKDTPSPKQEQQQQQQWQQQQQEQQQQWQWPEPNDLQGLGRHGCQQPEERPQQAPAQAQQNDGSQWEQQQQQPERRPGCSSSAVGGSILHEKLAQIKAEQLEQQQQQQL
ncbi:GL23807 [Drosophila persimilis]|uniref:GL23807 n=1 Tax=Drosophila persimilis TaxID=7234 RepID=B4G648_DROPE|nr:GL23807 [Drosophila persimilis]